jgi:hypothetical protein
VARVYDLVMTHRVDADDLFIHKDKDKDKVSPISVSGQEAKGISGSQLSLS